MTDMLGRRSPSSGCGGMDESMIFIILLLLICCGGWGRGGCRL